MTAITFDTLRFVEQLTDAGVPEPHAKAEAAALSDVFSRQYHDMATKGDLRELELRMDNKIESAKSERIKWMVGIALAQTALLIGLFLKLS